MGLPRLFRSLQAQSLTNWEAIILVVDGEPFSRLHHLVAETDDPRIWVFAEWTGMEFKATADNGGWAPQYHSLLYNLTDDAILGCPEDTAWLLVTNGDNEYAADFFDRIREESAAHPSADIVAFDFYSRYQRPTAPQCDRFAAAGAGAPLCKANRLRWCHTDLGSYALRHERFLRERRAFGAPVTTDDGRRVGAEHADGLLAQTLLRDGWEAAHVTDRCMFSHSPSPQACAWSGGTWDDRNMMATAPGGGKCLTKASDVRWILDNDPGAELVQIDVSNDGHISAFGSALEHGHGPDDPAAPLKLACIRRASYASPEVLGAAMDWFSRLCADDLDLPRHDARDKANALRDARALRQEL